MGLEKRDKNVYSIDFILCPLIRFEDLRGNTEGESVESELVEDLVTFAL